MGERKLRLLAILIGAFVGGAFAPQVGASAKVSLVSVTRLSSKTSTNRNYTASGSNALCSKAAPLAGSKLILSKSNMQKLGNSQSSKDYLRLYRVAKLSNGRYYGKVVSFDQKYRGWVYIGKTNPSKNYSAVKVGLTHAITSSPASLFVSSPTSTSTTDNSSAANANSTLKPQLVITADSTYYVAETGNQNDGKHVTYKAPMFTEYKAGRQVKDSTPYANDPLKATKAAVRTKEGDYWIYVVDSVHPEFSGWILAERLFSPDWAGAPASGSQPLQ